MDTYTNSQLRKAGKVEYSDNGILGGGHILCMCVCKTRSRAVVRPGAAALHAAAALPLA
jgi:hypothetical protein